MKKYFYLLAILNLVDGTCTYWGLIQHAITESNPFMDMIFQIHPLLFLGTKIVLSLLLAFVGLKFNTTSSHRIFWHIILVIPTLVYLFITGLHLYWILLYFQ